MIKLSILCEVIIVEVKKIGKDEYRDCLLELINFREELINYENNAINKMVDRNCKEAFWEELINTRMQTVKDIEIELNGYKEIFDKLIV